MLNYKNCNKSCKKNCEGVNNQPFTTIINKKEIILNELKKRGCRITNQRKLILDIIIQSECSCCKEIYYQAIQTDPSIGIATVYRMLKVLEEIGAINRRQWYNLPYENLNKSKGKLVFIRDNNDVIEFENKKIFELLQKELKNIGYENEDISIIIKINNIVERNDINDRFCYNY